MLSPCLPCVRRICYYLFWTVFHTARSQQAPLVLTQRKPIAACPFHCVSYAYNLHILLWKFILRPSPSPNCLKPRQRSSSTQQMLHHPPSWYQDCGTHISHCHIMPNGYYELPNGSKRWWHGWLHHHPLAPLFLRNIVKNTHMLPEHFHVLTFQWFYCVFFTVHTRTHSVFSGRYNMMWMYPRYISYQYLVLMVAASVLGGRGRYMSAACTCPHRRVTLHSPSDPSSPSVN